MSKRLKIAGALALVLALAAFIAGSVAHAGAGAALAANGENGCKLNGHGTELKHVIYLQFDNTHLFRDRSNFASDLEQMPHLMNFLRDNGTLSDNEHTILISHTILAAAVVPLVVMSLTYGLKSRFDRHRRISRWTFPVWLYVSITGVVVYIMLYQIYGGHA